MTERSPIGLDRAPRTNARLDACLDCEACTRGPQVAQQDRERSIADAATLWTVQRC